MHKLLIALTLLIVTSACGANSKSIPFKVEPVVTLAEPWAMTFLPDGRLLITEKRGHLLVVTQEGDVSNPITGLPDVDYRGQGGLGDVVLHPDYKTNSLIYISYVESGKDNTRGAAVARGRLEFDDRGRGHLEGSVIIWRQNPKVSGSGHYGHRLAFDKQGYLFISSGDRQKFDPAQDMAQNLGKVIRLHDDGKVPKDNPFSAQGGVNAEVWTLGHRNPLGIAFDGSGRLWVSEMGPLHGDELNLVRRGENYGYPIVSNGDHYNGTQIPDHITRPEFAAPMAYWDPTIAPAGLIFYSGVMFPEWRGSALIAGLAPRAIIRVKVEGDTAAEVERFDMGKRIRELEQGPDGALWVLEDKDGGRLLKITKTTNE